MKNLLITFLVTLCYLTINAQTPIGKWDTYDDETGEKKSTVEIYKVGDKLYGKIVTIYDKSNANAKCSKCTGNKKDKAIMGMVIINDLEKDGNEWEDGKILDPNNGKVYDCKVWVEDNDILKVRGYIGWLYRTQTWKRLK